MYYITKNIKPGGCRMYVAQKGWKAGFTTLIEFAMKFDSKEDAEESAYTDCGDVVVFIAGEK